MKTNISDAAILAGRRYGEELVMSGNIEELSRLYRLIGRPGHSLKECALNTSVVVGGLRRCVLILEAARASGVVFSISPPTRERLDYAIHHSDEEFRAVANLLIDGVQAMKARGMTWNVEAAVKPEPKPEPKLELPREVRIVGMPDLAIRSMPRRETETTIERDPAGNIKRSTQVESDA